MSRKKRKFEKEITSAEKELTQFRHIDLQRAVIIRGLIFDNVVNKSDFWLAQWFRENYENIKNDNLLEKFDEWRDDIIGHKVHPMLRMGYRDIEDDEGEKIIKRRPRKLGKVGKKRKQKNEKFGIFIGTKKELTFRSQNEGKSIEDTIDIVMKEFPDAKEKSIKIWYKKAKKLNQ